MLAAAALVLLVVLLSGGDSQSPPAAGGGGDPSRCRGLSGDDGRECLAREFTAMVRGRDDPRGPIEEISALAYSQRGFLLAQCHAIMHTVGRTYGRELQITPAKLMDALPRSNEPACAAGFAHGLVTAVAPDIDVSRPADAARVCGQMGTRYREYSCIHGFGHAFMRIFDGRLEQALHLCGALGPRAAPDCAQGSFHDYWFAVTGTDEAILPAPDATKDPRELCGAQPAVYVRPCWYRAYLENRPEAFAVAAAEDLDALCDGLTGLQREACITGAAVIGPADPAEQLAICDALRTTTDAIACIRGTKVQNLLGEDTATFVRLTDRCATLAGPVRPECYRWLGKAITVVTDGAFARSGCPRLADPAGRRECAEGARTANAALETFS